MRWASRTNSSARFGRIRSPSTRGWRGPHLNLTQGWDALASILNFNLSGGWYTDTTHRWLPDPALVDFQRALHARGYKGTQVEDGQIVKREPTRGDVGGVGEIVAGGGLVVRDPAQEARRRELIEGFRMTEQQADNALDEGGGTTPATGGPWLYGPQAWSTLLRQLAGVPANAPSVFDIAPAPVPIGAYPGLTTVIDETGNAVRTQAEPTLPAAYLHVLPPAVATRVAQGVRDKYLSAQAAAEAWSGAP